MEDIVRLWVPIGAIVISVISLLLSLSNRRFNKRFEAAKKRTEIDSLFLKNATTFETKSMQYLLGLNTCKGCEDCPKDIIARTHIECDKSLKDLSRQWYRLEKSISADPIEFENFLTIAQKGFAEIAAFMHNIDEFIDKSKECAGKREKGSPKS